VETALQAAARKDGVPVVASKFHFFDENGGVRGSHSFGWISHIHLYMARVGLRRD